MRFRRNLERLGEIFAYEISKTLPFAALDVETPLGIANTLQPSGRVVLSTILRAGLPMHTGMLNYFDNADNAFISAYRQNHKDGTFEIKLDYVASPDIQDAALVMVDPMLATGSSLHVAIQELMRFGTPSSLHIVAAIASQAGLEYIRRLYPHAHIWLGDLDEELTAKSYIVPGLGDAGDCAFGGK